MTCEIVETERALFVAWGTPSSEDVERIVARAQVHAQTKQAPVFYVTRVPSEAPAPDAEVRRHLNQRLPVIIEHCSCYHVILEGDGFFAAMKRGVLLSLFQLTQKRGLFHVHATVEAFRKEVPAEWRVEVNRLLELATERDLLVGAIPCERSRDGSGAFAVGGKNPNKSGKAQGL